MSLGPLMIDLRGTQLEERERKWLRSPVVGGVILFSRNFADLDQLEQLVREIHAERTPSLLVAVDQEGGRVQRFKAPFCRLPAVRALGRLYDEDRQQALEAAHDLGWLMAAELRAVDIDLSFAPVVDLDRGLADVIGDRALHTNAAAVTALAMRVADGMHAAGMPVTAKHFPTHAGVTADSHTAQAVDRRPFGDLLDDLSPYRRLIGAGLQAVMVGHVSFPDVDPLPASQSAWWIKEQLRGELGFTGAVISDDISMAGANSGGGVQSRALKAIGAGCDMVLLCNAAEEIPATIEALQGYVSPPGQLRLMRLRGTHRQPWSALRASPEWQRATERAERLCERPRLELEG
jgi:beta-N-acetylhexosaminidase